LAFSGFCWRVTSLIKQRLRLHAISVGQRRNGNPDGIGGTAARGAGGNRRDPGILAVLGFN